MYVIGRTFSYIRVKFAIAVTSISLLCSTSVIAQSISNSSSLTFGSFAADVGGTVSVTPAGSRSASGGVVLIPSGPGSSSQSTVSGTNGSTYSITLPANGIVSLSDTSSHTMAVNSFVSNPSATTPSSGLLLGGGQLLTIGATLTVGKNQPAGNYSGTFSVVVSYP